MSKFTKECSNEGCTNVQTYAQRSSYNKAVKNESTCRQCRSAKHREYMTGRKYTEVTKKRMSATHQKRLHNIDLPDVPDYVPSSDQYKLKDWSKKISEKYRCTCDGCGATAESKGRKLDSHHIKPRGLFPESRFDVDNGILLCRSCHKKLHAELDRRVEIMAKPRELLAEEYVKITNDWLIR